MYIVVQIESFLDASEMDNESIKLTLIIYFVFVIIQNVSFPDIVGVG